LAIPVQENRRSRGGSALATSWRTWEAHKYASPQEQDANLDMLIDWISRYSERDDTCSAAAHRRLYASFSGKKHMLTDNTETT